MSEVTYQQFGEDNWTIDYIDGEWYTAHTVSDEDIEKMKESFDYDYIEKKYGWSE